MRNLLLKISLEGSVRARGFMRAAFCLVAAFLLSLALNLSPAYSAPILLPGDVAGVACGPNLHLKKTDFVGDGGSYSTGCNVEAQVSFLKIFAGVDTVNGLSLNDLVYEAGAVVPLGYRTRVVTGIKGNTAYETGGFMVDPSFTVISRVVVVLKR